MDVRHEPTEPLKLGGRTQHVEPPTMIDGKYKGVPLKVSAQAKGPRGLSKIHRIYWRAYPNPTVDKKGGMDIPHSLKLLRRVTYDHGITIAYRIAMATGCDHGSIN